MYTLYKFHFLNGISEINQLFDDILIIWPAPVQSNIMTTHIFYFIYNPKSEKVGTVWKTQIKKESSDF